MGWEVGGRAEKVELMIFYPFSNQDSACALLPLKVFALLLLLSNPRASLLLRGEGEGRWTAHVHTEVRLRLGKPPASPSSFSCPQQSLPRHPTHRPPARGAAVTLTGLPLWLRDRLQVTPTSFAWLTLSCLQLSSTAQAGLTSHLDPGHHFTGLPVSRVPESAPSSEPSSELLRPASCRS